MDSDVRLENKRVEVQHNLLKLRLVMKLEQNQSLSDTEQQYYELWKTTSANNQKMPRRRSRMLINQVSQKDKGILDRFRLSEFNQ